MRGVSVKYEGRLRRDKITFMGLTKALEFERQFGFGHLEMGAQEGVEEEVI